MTLDRFRTAMTFSLWTWALYWPLGGLLLLGGGLDPVSIAVTFSSLGAFLLLAFSGALRANSSRTMKEFFLERPFYLIAVGILLLALTPLFSPAEDAGLLIFATTYLAGIVLCVKRLHDHVRESGKTAWALRADQAYLMFGIVAVAAFMVFIDAWLPIFSAEPAGGSTVTVALANWINLLYPPMLLVATKPFRHKLSFRRPRADKPDPDAADADAA